ELARVTVDTRANIVCVTESHLDRDDSIDDISIPEGYYVAARKDRTANGGGVLIIAQQSLMGSEFDVSNFYLPEKSEMVAFSLQEYVIVCCYTQPSQSDYTLVSQMQLLEEKVRSQERKVIFVGDFNGHNVKWLTSEKDNQLGLKLEEFCQMSGLENVVKQPTREKAFLDLILTPGDGKVHILPKLGSSDHRTI
ncbi:unnamed protein product, partial [Heterosigma akashiwo]